MLLPCGHNIPHQFRGACSGLESNLRRFRRMVLLDLVGMRLQYRLGLRHDMCISFDVYDAVANGDCLTPLA